VIGLWVGMFCFCSSTMTIFNKLASKALPDTITLVIMQNCVSLLLALAIGNIVGQRGSPDFRFKQPLTAAIVLKWLPAVCLFTGMLVSSLYALKLTSVPFTIVCRSLTPHFSALLEIIFFGNYIRWRTWASLFSILAGAVIFLVSNPGAGSYGVEGYFFALMNLVCASFYAVYVKFVINTIRPSTMDLVVYNNLLSLPLLAGFIWIDDLPNMSKTFGAIDAEGWLWICLSMLIAGSISFAGFGLQGAVTATTATVAQHSSKIVSMLLSLAVFPNTPFTPMMWLAVCITFAGTGWYAFERKMEGKVKSVKLVNEKANLLDDGTPRSWSCKMCLC